MKYFMNKWLRQLAAAFTAALAAVLAAVLAPALPPMLALMKTPLLAAVLAFYSITNTFQQQLLLFFRSMQQLVLTVAVTYKRFQLTSDLLAVSISGERNSQFSVSIFLINGPISSYILDHYGSQLSVCGAYIAC